MSGVDERRTKKRGPVIAAVVAAAVVLVVVVTFIVVALVAQPDQSETAAGDETSVAASADAPASDSRRSFYSFGHTSASIDMGGAAGSLIQQRLPFVPTVTPDRFRIVVRNWQYLDDTALPGELDVESIYIGKEDQGGHFNLDAVRLSDPHTLSDGESLTTDWFDADAALLEAGQRYLLGVAFTPRSGQVAVNPAVGWIKVGQGAGPLTADAQQGEYSRAGMYLDIAIEYAFDDPDQSVPVATVFGHSLNSGANGNPDVPHDGETTSWHQLWAVQNGGIAASFAAPGSWTAHFAPDSPKWSLADTTDADIVAVWASSSDLVSGTPPDAVGVSWVALVNEARARWPDAKIVAFTEPPRGAEGEGEQYRLQWNEYLRSSPLIDGLVDADSILADPAHPNALNPVFDGDGTHISPAGHQAIADAFQQAVEGVR